MFNLKKIAPVALAAMLILAGCTSGSTTASSIVESASSAVESTASAVESALESSGVDVEVPAVNMVEGLKEELNNLTLNEYEGLEMTAAVLERKAILSAGSMNVNVSIKNNGDKTITYQVGSGGNQIPAALYVYSDNLQTVIPVSNLGPKTMDMRHDTLAPGEELSFVYTVMAIEPNANFDQYTWDTFSAGESEYIANLAPDELKERFPDLVPVAEGSYDIHAIFRYAVETDNPLGNATGYSQADFTVGVSA